MGRYIGGGGDEGESRAEVLGIVRLFECLGVGAVNAVNAQPLRGLEMVGCVPVAVAWGSSVWRCGGADGRVRVRVRVSVSLACR